MPEPWLRGTLTELDAVRRQVVHALQLAEEDIERWCTSLNDEQMNARPCGVAPVAFHLRHIARSLDRLLTYADGRSLSGQQMDALASEMSEGAYAENVLAEVRMALIEAQRRIRMISPESYEEPRGVGRAALPSTVGGLLVHCAEHTQRHVGQTVTLSKIVTAMANHDLMGRAER